MTRKRPHVLRLAPVAAAFSILAATLGVPAMPALAQQNVIPGIDVSHWQGTIDWPQVARSGVRFAFIKATDGYEDSTFLDDQYAINVAGARSNGIKVGSYHFARPDVRTADDALTEARWFVNNLDLQAGDLPPVLDIEVNEDGISTDQMNAWAMQWLDEVRRLTGVTPLVYTSPSGWEDRFADSTQVAEAGYRLWLAHWTQLEPRVPAADWNGQGWTVWQYSSKGTVPGITGKVDMNWALAPLDQWLVRGLTVTRAGSDGTLMSDPTGLDCGDDCTALFDPGTVVSVSADAPVGSFLRSYAGDCSGRLECVVTMDTDREVIATFAADTVPPTFTLEAPTTASGAVVLRFSEPVSGVHGDDLALARAGGGGGAVATSFSCRARNGAEVSCEEGAVRRVDLTPVDPLGAGQAFKVSVNVGPGHIEDRAKNPVASSTTEFVSAASVEDATGDVSYAWRTVKAKGAQGGSYVVERTAGATASFDFNGPSIGWYTVVGPTFGSAEVFVDGQSKGIVDLGASAIGYGTLRTYRGLGAGPHTFTVRIVGDGSVAVDAFRVGKTVQLSPTVRTTWGSVTAATASAGTYAVAQSPRARAVVRFTGSAITWLSFVGPDMGQARVIVDGVVLKTVSNYAANVARKNWRFEGLGAGEHVLVIEVLGTKAGASSGTRIVLDGFVVSG